MISKNFTKTHLSYGIKFFEKMKNILQEYPEIPLEALGFTEDWEKRLS